MTQVTFFIHQDIRSTNLEDIKANRVQTVSAFVAAVPRLGETVALKINGASVKTCVEEVVHHPALEMPGFPQIFITLKVLKQEA